MKSILCGARLDSFNRGVNALAIGGVSFIHKNYKSSEIIIVNIGKKKCLNHNIVIENKAYSITSKRFSGIEFIKAFIWGLLSRLIKVNPKDELSKLIRNSDNAYNINEGDSFSDIYGKSRFFAHFFVSLTFLAWKKPLTFLPQTIGPFDTTYGRIFSTFVLKRLKKLYVRDTAAIFFLNERRINSEMKPDVACLMQPKKIGNINIETPNNTYIGLNINGLMYFNTYGFSNYSEEYKSLLNYIVQYCHKHEHKVILIPHTYDVNRKFSENDYEANLDFILKNNYKSNKDISSISTNYDAQEIKFLISQMQLFIGSRMHSCIASLSSNVPTLGLAYSYKFKGTFSVFKQENYAIDINKCNHKIVDAKITEIINNSSNISKTLSEINKLISQ